MRKVERTISILFIMALTILVLGRSQVSPSYQLEKIRTYTRMVEFDYTTWTIDALFGKVAQNASGITRYITASTAKEIVLDYVQIVDKVQHLEGEIESIYANPQIPNPEEVSSRQLEELKILQTEKKAMAALAESIIQSQISQVINEMELAFIRQPIPPLLYHVTELPLALIVSPREVIQQDANISLEPELNIEEITSLESAVSEGLDVSSLVTRIGGVGVYPTMISQTTSLDWLIEVVAHEWIHNYLTLHPLGIRYDTTPELRTMNETTANIAGKEISLVVLEHYYPEYLPAPVQQTSEPEEIKPVEPTPPVFDFNAEMRITREQADTLLASGKIEEAEQYMDSRRQVFWDNGYQIRKLNQAYFAFHGAYADVPGGAAGEDPVGPAVRQLREKSSSLSAFINSIAKMRSYDDLLLAIQ